MGVKKNDLKDIHVSRNADGRVLVPQISRDNSWWFYPTLLAVAGVLSVLARAYGVLS